MEHYPSSLATAHVLPNRNVYLLGRRLTLMTVSAIVESIGSAIAQNRQITICNYNVHGFNLSMQLPWFYSFLQSADIVHCDGMGIIKALKFLGLDLPYAYRVSYTLLMPALLDECDRKGFKMFLLGAQPKNLAAALANLRERYPKASFAGQHGYFPRDDAWANARVIDAINAAQVDILMVGMGMPIQEEWVMRHRDQLNVKVILVGGAVIDRLAAHVSDCPVFLSRIGLEWAYRLSREPRRLGARYLLGNPAFICHILLAKILGLQGQDKTEQSSLQASSLCQSISPKPNGVRKRLGEYLVETGVLTPEQVNHALKEQRHSQQRLGEILVAQGIVHPEMVTFIVTYFHRQSEGQRQ